MRSRGLGLASIFVLLLAAALVACGDAREGEDVAGGASPLAPFLFPNDKTAYEYFAGKGLASFQAAGIVGNLDQESGVDPAAVQAGGPGRGIAQWSVGGRWDTDPNDNAVAYAKQQGVSVDSLQLQLDFVWYELTTFPSYGLAKLRASTDVTGATVAFETDFEGCGQCNESQRVAYAKGVLAAYGGAPAPGDAGAAPDGGSEDAGPARDGAAAEDGAVPPAGGDAGDSTGEGDGAAPPGLGASADAHLDASTGCDVAGTTSLRGGRPGGAGGGWGLGAVALGLVLAARKREARPGAVRRATRRLRTGRGALILRASRERSSAATLSRFWDRGSRLWRRYVWVQQVFCCARPVRSLGVSGRRLNALSGFSTPNIE